MQATRLFTIALVSFLFSTTADSFAQTVTHVPHYTFNGDELGGQFGFSVSGAGDVNGDGTPDLIVGLNGSARVLSGSDRNILYNFNGDHQFDGFGQSVSGAGDVNGDGFDDLIVGAPSANSNNGLDSGSARVLSGSDGSVLYNFDGESTDDYFGWSVSGAGDVNGDGTPDLIVGAPTAFGPFRGRGSARVLSGSDGSVLYKFNGDTEGDVLGVAVSGAGDVNGDGFDDLIVGATGDDNNGDSSGSARVLSGSDGSVLYNFNGDSEGDVLGIAVSGAGDVNGDGFDDLIVGAPTDDNNGDSSGSARVFSGSDGSVLYTFNGESEFDRFGIAVSGAGDVNGDGFDDLIVGASWANNDGLEGNFQGSARVLSGVDGQVLYNFTGNNGEYFGTSVSSAGDVNGDGFDDFIIGAPGRRGGYAQVFVSQISQPELLLGDCNQDGVVNFLDIAPFIAILSAGEFLEQADTNEDGVVDFLDIAPFIALLTL